MYGLQAYMQHQVVTLTRSHHPSLHISTVASPGQLAAGVDVFMGFQMGGSGPTKALIGNTSS